jgi:regulator of protease activity HflC (stomatin/prohibitin superfamily)
MFMPKEPWIWFTRIYLLSFVVIFGLSALLGGIWGLSISSIVMVVVLIIFIVISWNTIPYKHEWIIEYMGKYTGHPLCSGLHLIFPIFTILKSKNLVNSDQIMELYLDEKKNEALDGGVVDFKDASAPVKSKTFFRITDAVKATYEIEDVFKGIEERLDSALRSFLANYTIDEAGSLKIYFNIGIILNGILVEKEEGKPVSYRDADGEKISLKPGDNSGLILSDGTEKKPAVLEEIEKWGVTIKTIVITDIVLSAEIREQRRLVLEASQKAQAAVHTKQAAITASEGALQVAKNKAEGEEYTLDKRGQGMNKQIKEVTTTGLTEREASNHITKTQLYENIGDKAVILETSGTAVGQGAQIGAGAAAVSSVVK